MYISIFDLFKIGVGPSSSHTVGPINATNQFIDSIIKNNLFEQTERIQFELFGSLAFTGKGHGTDNALILGLLGLTPITINPKESKNLINNVKKNKLILLNKKKPIPFDFNNDIKFNLKEKKIYHSNAISIKAYNQKKQIIYKEIYYSTGGGFIVNHKNINIKESKKEVPFMFNSSKELLELCKNNNFYIYDLMMKNELTINSKTEIQSKLKKI